MTGTGADPRTAALWRFAIAITVFNLLGHTVFGFEQAFAHPVVALATSYALELLLESIEAWRLGREPRYRGGGVRGLIEFLLPAHITALAIGMLLYSNARLMPTVFATAVAIASKYLLRVPVQGRPRHFFNPSNLGITVTLLTFHWVGIAPPYMFTENLHDAGDWILPLFLVCAGSFLNGRFTKRLPLVVTWLAAFSLQAVVRTAAEGLPTVSALLPLTGMSVLLFTFYMVSDPSTTPSSPRRQVVFAASVAAVYGMLVALHVVFGMFFALSLVCAGRGAILAWSAYRLRQRATLPAAAAPLAPAGSPAPLGGRLEQPGAAPVLAPLAPNAGAGDGS
jgi:hypothetical protein